MAQRGAKNILPFLKKVSYSFHIASPDVNNNRK